MTDFSMFEQAAEEYVGGRFPVDDGPTGPWAAEGVPYVSMAIGAPSAWEVMAGFPAYFETMVAGQSGKLLWRRRPHMTEEPGRVALRARFAVVPA